ncbi:MAG: choice-of-anchor D domain-containing protein, partial [Bacteroidales bacterium]|nr:choice-of-anchor D domain-containing protein [Bacteroidales bacterium]
MKKLLLIVCALSFSASMIAQETVPFVAVPSQASAGLVSYNATLVGGYTLGIIDWDGFATTIQSGTYGNELTCDISGPLGSATVTLGNGTTYAPGATFTGNTGAFDNAGDPAGDWTFDFYETYDDGGDGLPDATWDNIDFDFNVYAVPGVTAPWTEPFAGTSAPTFWTNSGAESWLFSTGAAYGAAAAGDHTPGGGTNYAWIDGSGGVGVNELKTPPVDVSALTIPEFSFWYFSNNTNNPGDNNTLFCDMQIDGGGWANILTYAGDNANWQKFTHDLSSYTITSGVEFRFIVTGTAATEFYNDILVDDVAVDEMPVTPIITVSPASPNDYGYVQIGSTPSQTFTVTNTGGGTANITGASIAGNPEFTIFSTTGIPGSLPPDLIEIVVDFAPLAIGTYSATLTITDAGGTTDVLLSGEGVAVVPNDDCANATPIVGPYPVLGITGTTIGATPDCVAEPTVYYEVTLPYASNNINVTFCPTADVLGIDITSAYLYYATGCSCGSWVGNTGYDFTSCTGTAPTYWFNQVAGPGTIYLPVTIKTSGNSWETDFQFDIDVTEYVVAPGFTCAAPIVIGSLGYTTSDNTSNYGDDYSSTDEICSGSSYLNGDDVVYSYTPAVDECIDIALTGTGTWVGLFVYEGCAPFTACVGIDTQSGGNPSLTGLNLTAGTTYYIIISTWPSPQSTAYDMTVDLCAAPPANDDCSGAIALAVDCACTPITATNLAATDSGETPGCANYQGGDVWFSAVVPANGYLVVETAVNGGFTDGGMAAWTGTCAGLTLYECDDDDGPGAMSMIEIDDIGLAGQTLYFSVWEYGNNSFGDFDICAHTSPLDATWTGTISNDWHDAGNWNTV